MFQLNLSLYKVKASDFTSSEQSLLTASDFHSLQKSYYIFSPGAVEERLKYVVS